MKRYTIKFDDKNSNNSSFRNNASKNLDDLIISNLIKMNPYLEGTYKKDSTLDAMFAEAGFNTEDDHIIIRNTGYNLKGNFDSDFAKAAKFLANYKPTKTYKLYDGSPITFFEDEIQIGYDLIPLYELSSPKYYYKFTPEQKNIIINIFISINR